MAANLPQAIDTKLQSVQKDINSHIDSKFTELSELLKCPQVGLIPRVSTLEKIVKLDDDCLLNRCDNLHKEIMGPRGGYALLKQAVYGTKGGTKLGLIKEFQDCQSTVGDQFIGNSALARKVKDLSEDMKKVNDPATGLCTRLNNMEKSKTGGGGISKAEFDAVLKRIKALEDVPRGSTSDTPERSDLVNARLSALERQMNIAGTMLDMTEKKIDTLDSRVTMNTAKLLSNNVKIMGIPFEDKEDAKQVCMDFFTKYMSFTAHNREIIAAFRMPGVKFVYINRKRVKLPPLMFVKCSDSLKRKIEEGLPLLDGKKHEKFHYRLGIKRHEPDAIIAAKIRYQEQIGNLIARNQHKGPNEQDSFFFRGSALFVNGKKVVDPLVPPLPKVLLDLTEGQIEELEELPITEGVVDESDKGSRYFSYAARVTDLEHIRKLYQKIRLQHLPATHVSAGFRFGISTDDSAVPVLRSGGAADGEHQADTRICHAINKSGALDVVVFVVRYYGGAPLGTGRLKNVYNFSSIALDNLKAYALSIGSPLRTYTAPGEEGDPGSPPGSPGESEREDVLSGSSPKRAETLPKMVDDGELSEVESEPDGASDEELTGTNKLGVTPKQVSLQESTVTIPVSPDVQFITQNPDANLSKNLTDGEEDGSDVADGVDEVAESSREASTLEKTVKKKKKRKPKKLTVTPKKVRRDKRLNKQLFNEFESY